MKNPKHLIIVILLFIAFTSNAQLGIGTNTPNENAALEIQSTSQGMLFPRMTTAQRDDIANPAKGLTIFNNTLNCIQTNIGTSAAVNWKCLGISPTSNGTAIVSAYTCATALTGTLVAGVAVSNVTQTITATVITVGTFSISSMANGVTFAASGTFSNTGNQDIVLTATGTPATASSNSFTLNTTPNCSFSRTTLASLSGNITLSSISSYFIASVYDQDYLPYSAPTNAASLFTPVSANGVNESVILDLQGTLTTTGVSINIPYTVVTASVNLPAFSQTITIPASYTQDGISRDISFSYAAATYGVGTGNVPAILKAIGGSLNIKKLDLQTGIGNDNLGFLLAQFIYVRNSVGALANFDFRAIAGIADINISDTNHIMFYLPILGYDGKTWLNNNLGADYSNTAKLAFNPAQQATAINDFKAYGSLFQWGRNADGHELINYSSSTVGSSVNDTTTTLSSSDNPGHSLFILTNRTDWRSPKNDSLWQGVNGINKPCPIGFRLPTETEWNTQSLTWISGAFNSPLKLTLAGSRNVKTGLFNTTGSGGFYWSSTFNLTYSQTIYFTSSTVSISQSVRSSTYSVRCIKD